MILKMYAVYDTKTEMYSSPFLRLKRGQAIRDWTDEITKESHPVAKHPADFTLFEIGEYDDNSGFVQAYDAKVPLGSALELMSTTRNDENRLQSV